MYFGDSFYPTTWSNYVGIQNANIYLLLSYTYSVYSIPHYLALYKFLSVNEVYFIANAFLCVNNYTPTYKRTTGFAHR